MPNRLFVDPIEARAVHIDTVRLSHAYNSWDLPPPLNLKSLGLDITFKERRNNEITTAYAKPVNNMPFLMVTRSENERSYSGITVECSLAKLVNGTGLGVQTAADIECAFDAIDDYIIQRLGVVFDTRTALVKRFDVNADFYVGEDRINLYLASLSRPDSRLKAGHIERGTNYFFNKSRTFAIYGKKEEMKQQLKKRKATQEDVLAAEGLLRVEKRLLTREAVKRYASSKSLEANAKDLLTTAVASAFIADSLSQLSLDKPKYSLKARTDLLVEYFGNKTAELLGMLILREYYGEDFWKKVGIDYQAYNRKKKILKAANLWDVSPAEALPALVIPNDL